MKLLIVSNNKRGLDVINFLKKDFEISTVLPEKFNKDINGVKNKLIIPKNINNQKFINKIKELSFDIIIIAGFNQIISQKSLTSTRAIWLNLHAGELPSMRGSSPLNWALIKNHKTITINVIKVDAGIDSGNIVEAKKFSINNDDNIKTIHDKVNKFFPVLVKKAINKILKNSDKSIKQKNISAYYPIRFPDDGVIFFDNYTALEVYNKIRALMDPYPNAFSYFEKQKIKIISCRMPKNNFYGEPGRVYKILNDELLVCAKDKSLWIKLDKKITRYKIKRYERLATLTEAAMKFYENKK